MLGFAHMPGRILARQNPWLAIDAAQEPIGFLVADELAIRPIPLEFSSAQFE